MPVPEREGMTASPLALFDIGGRSAVVTGATGAFGQAASKALAAAGARVTAAGGNEEKLTALAMEIMDAGGDVETVARRPETEADAEAIVALAGPQSPGKRRVRRALEGAARTRSDIVVPTLVLAELYRGPGDLLPAAPRLAA